MSEYIIEIPDYVPPFDPAARAATLRKEIVRCRDCKHYTDYEWVLVTDVSDVCHFWHGKPTKVEPDGFCAWGERKKSE